MTTLICTISALILGIIIGIEWKNIWFLEAAESENSVKIMGRKFWVVEDRRP